MSFACPAFAIVDQAALNREATVNVYNNVFAYEIIKKGVREKSPLLQGLFKLV
jgi:hypothetical protein